MHHGTISSWHDFAPAAAGQVCRNASMPTPVLARLSDGFRYLMRLASMLIIGASAAMLLTACQVAEPRKGPEPVPEQPVAAAQASPNPLSAADEASILPPKVLVPGVPFVGFAEAARIRLPHGALMYSNPSQTACLAMVLENWGYSQALLERAESPELDKWSARLAGPILWTRSKRCW